MLLFISGSHLSYRHIHPSFYLDKCFSHSVTDVVLCSFFFRMTLIIFGLIHYLVERINFEDVMPYDLDSMFRHARTFTHANGLRNFQIEILPLLCTLMQ